MKKKSRRKFILFILLLICAFVFGKDFIIRKSAEIIFEAKSGLKLNIESLNLNLFKPCLTINNAKIFNPKGFSRNPMIEIKTVRASYIWNDLFRNTLHITELFLDIKSLNVEQKTNGQLNLLALKNTRSEEDEEDTAAPGKELKEKSFNILIDELILSFERATYSGPYLLGNRLEIKIFIQNKHISNISSLSELLDIITDSSGISQIEDIFSDKPGSLRNSIENTIESIKKYFK
ncbi:MAG: hypothetical protein JW728_08075 [Candidatus Aureabacteria bacterium]|nr:hypothetical protein [Candidatus Auribacterota bacterium]